MDLAQALFRTGDYEGALSTFRLLDLAGLHRADRSAVQYLMACCLRRLGKLDQAAALYREIVNSGDDDMLAECAQWQLGAIQWRQTLQAQLEGLRQRRQALELRP
jgi:hypothetical protein